MFDFKFSFILKYKYDKVFQNRNVIYLCYFNNKFAPLRITN